MTHTNAGGRRTGAGARALTGAAVAAFAAMLYLAPAAPAAKLGGKTTLAPEASTIAALGDAGITVAPSGKAKAGDAGISFPIRGGKVNVDDVSGKIRHRGGLTFSSHGTSVTLQGYVIKLGSKNVIRARVAGGGKVRLAELDLGKAKVAQRGGKVVISNVKALLANKAGKALADTFGIPNLRGAELGVAKVTVRP